MHVTQYTLRYVVIRTWEKSERDPIHCHERFLLRIKENENADTDYFAPGVVRRRVLRIQPLRCSRRFGNRRGHSGDPSAMATVGRRSRESKNVKDPGARIRRELAIWEHRAAQN